MALNGLARLTLASLASVTMATSCGSQSGDRAHPAPVAQPSSPDLVPTAVDARQTQLDELANERQRVSSVREQSAAHAVRGFYSAIDHDDFLRAWSRLSPNLQTQFGGYEQWKTGYGSSVSSEVTSAIGHALDNQGDRVEVRLALRAVDVDICSRRVAQRFNGTWHLSRSNGLWRAQSISVRKTGGGTVRTSVADCAGSGDTAIPDYSSPTPTPSYDPPSYDPPAIPDTSPGSDYSNGDGTYNGGPTTDAFGSGSGSIGTCSDGTYSDSIGRSGACSHHGGVGP